MSTSTDVSKMTFEAALSELESIITKLEGGEVALEESIDLYERGAKLRAHCETKLKSAREKIEKIVLDADGSPSTASAQFD